MYRVTMRQRTKFTIALFETIADAKEESCDPFAIGAGIGLRPEQVRYLCRDFKAEGLIVGTISPDRNTGAVKMTDRLAGHYFDATYGWIDWIRNKHHRITVAWSIISLIVGVILGWLLKR